MRKRDLRALREQHNRERWRDAWAPIDAATDEALSDAYAADRDDETEPLADGRQTEEKK